VALTNEAIERKISISPRVLAKTLMNCDLLPGLK
jgi:hypothetical protein